MFFSRVVMIFPVVMVMALDLVFTLLCQPADYWLDYSQCNEINPIGRTVLSFGPEWFAISFVLYAFCVLAIAVKAQGKMNALLILLVLAGHTHGSSTWFPRVVNELLSIDVSEPVLLCGYLAAIAVISVVCFRAVSGAKPLAKSA